MTSISTGTKNILSKKDLFVNPIKEIDPGHYAFKYSSRSPDFSPFLSFDKALASICRILSRVTPNS